MLLKFLEAFLFCRRHRTRYPRRVSAAKTCPGPPETWLCTWGRYPNEDRTPTAAGPPAASITASDDARQRRQQPRQAERRTGPAPAPCTAGGPAHAGQRTDHHHGPPAPRHRQRPPRSTAAPRTRHPAPAAGPPHGPPRPHRARTADAPPRRPTTSPTPPRTPDSGPRWTGGPAAYGYRLLLYLYA